ncbi:MAG: Peptidase M23B [uncultured bacterium]|nr:MAG: Peptidase M23B [uncultured bacterium]KKP95898.1 MAG: hypothetical protein US02_C0007G0010 [Candidatus Levybacteria bacterium GW2011_GWA2_36_13]KKQ00353.1 MAG: hypothetical protein US07_C0014G0010 [Candidatus Levybacteria bacterium GW2011_GWB1_36_18]KKQ57921.1 MAG: Peptidase M23B [Microgenomates group bacterium GW2011_GWC1_38_14]KKR14878.1 MAG: hypothetical protein UT44_C0048G0005 [Candidatus Levybacteria bacterium GW2011_GWA1_39_32]OGH43528.1 MAG: hypothetical protein A3I49_02275 [Cand
MSEVEGGEGLPVPEQSRNEYLRPFPQSTIVSGVETEGPAHTGPFRGAVDFIVPLGTPVLAPLDGVVKMVVDDNDRFGVTEEFKDDANFITIRHVNDELSELVHLAKGSARVKKGDRVRTGQQIATTGNSGWMDQPHLHFLVFQPANTQEQFQGVTPRFRERKPGLLTKFLRHRTL